MIACSHWKSTFRQIQAQLAIGKKGSKRRRQEWKKKEANVKENEVASEKEEAKARMPIEEL